MVINAKVVTSEFLPFLRAYKDGTVERFLDSPYVPSSPRGLTTDVLSKDILISPDDHLSARLYLPKLSADSNSKKKLPILLYFHGGGFCFESAFSFLSHRYITALTSQAKALVISVEYRLAPEHPLPTAYQDSWAALQWVASHQDPWLIHHGNFDRVYVGGDSAGANIAHHLAMKVSSEGLHGGVKIHGVILSHPFFWGSQPIGSEESVNIVDREKGNMYKTWMFAYPGAPGGIDNPMINPFAENAPSLSGLGCSKLLVCVASKDELRERGVHYCDVVRESGWKGEIQLFEMEGEGHIFHILGHPGTANARKMINCLASFLRH